MRDWPGLPGRPLRDRAALARAFVAKAVMGLPTTSMLIERLAVDKRLRRLCGWECPGQVPSESTFSRAFAEFATCERLSRVHEALIKRTHKDRLVGHISRDATAIEAREKAVKVATPETPKRKRGRPKNGVVVEKEPRRLERQATMSLAEMLNDLPKHCAVGTKRNAKGYKTTWNRLQAAHRHGRRRHSDNVPSDLRLVARQPGGNPACNADRRAGDQSLRPDGQRL